MAKDTRGGKRVTLTGSLANPTASKKPGILQREHKFIESIAKSMAIGGEKNNWTPGDVEGVVQAYAMGKRISLHQEDQLIDEIYRRTEEIVKAKRKGK